MSFGDWITRLFGRGEQPGGVGKTVSVDRAQELLAEGATMVDVRESSEWRTGHAPAAIHIPLADLTRRAGRFNKDQPIIVVCASGMRSRTGAQTLRSLGYTATSLSGGMRSWSHAGGRVIR